MQRDYQFMASHSNVKETNFTSRIRVIYYAKKESGLCNRAVRTCQNKADQSTLKIMQMKSKAVAMMLRLTVSSLPRCFDQTKNSK